MDNNLKLCIGLSVALISFFSGVTIAHGQSVCTSPSSTNTTGSTAVINQVSGQPYPGLRLLYVNKSIDSADYMHMSGGVLSTLNRTGSILTVTVLIYNGEHQLIGTQPVTADITNISPRQQLFTYEVIISPSMTNNTYTYIPIFHLT